MTEKLNQEALEFTYTNWRGETSPRRAVPHSLIWGHTEFHREPQWLLLAFDIDKQADRSFALKDMVFSASLAERTRERDEALAERDMWRANVEGTNDDWHKALDRAEAAEARALSLEAERDEARKERDEARAYLKAFVRATIDPEGGPKQDAQLHQANPTLGWIFTLNDTGMGDREILGSQIRRAMEIVGYDKLSIEGPETTMADEHVAALSALRAAEADRSTLLAENSLLKSAVETPLYCDEIVQVGRAIFPHINHESTHDVGAIAFDAAQAVKRILRDRVAAQSARAILSTEASHER